jgi:hypothetical protein
MDIMIDLETLSTDTDTAVVSIGACLFDIKTGEIPSTFYMSLQLQDQFDNGRKVSESTLKWWFTQNDSAKSVFRENAMPPKEALDLFSNWLTLNVPDIRKRKVWGNGSGFDVSIMEHMYKASSIPVPWTFGNIMDFRTFRRFMADGAKVENIGTHHNALDDALSQAQFVIKYSKKEKSE